MPTWAIVALVVWGVVAPTAGVLLGKSIHQSEEHERPRVAVELGGTRLRVIR